MQGMALSEARAVDETPCTTNTTAAKLSFFPHPQNPRIIDQLDMRGTSKGELERRRCTCPIYSPVRTKEAGHLSIFYQFWHFRREAEGGRAYQARLLCTKTNEVLHNVAWGKGPLYL